MAANAAIPKRRRFIVTCPFIENASLPLSAGHISEVFQIGYGLNSSVPVTCMLLLPVAFEFPKQTPYVSLFEVDPVVPVIRLTPVGPPPAPPVTATDPRVPPFFSAMMLNARDAAVFV